MSRTVYGFCPAGCRYPVATGAIIADNVPVTAIETSTTIAMDMQLSGLATLNTLTLESNITLTDGKFYTIVISYDGGAMGVSDLMTFSGVFTSTLAFGSSRQGVPFYGLDSDMTNGCSHALCKINNVGSILGDEEEHTEVVIATHRDITKGWLATGYRITVREY